MLETLRRGGSNEYLKSVLDQNKNRYTLAYVKVGFKWVFIAQTCVPDEKGNTRVIHNPGFESVMFGCHETFHRL